MARGKFVEVYGIIGFSHKNSRVRGLCGQLEKRLNFENFLTFLANRRPTKRGVVWSKVPFQSNDMAVRWMDLGVGRVYKITPKVDDPFKSL